jgi:hypothetical protein
MDGEPVPGAAPRRLAQAIQRVEPLGPAADDGNLCLAHESAGANPANAVTSASQIPSSRSTHSGSKTVPK